MNSHAFINSDPTKFDSNCSACGGKHRDSIHANAQAFENAALYRSGMFGVSRTDCKTITVETGQKYAQYSDAIKVTYLEKGKRKPMAFMLTYKPWLRIMSVTDAVTPADALVDNGSGSRMSRYSSCDPRYMTEFEDTIRGRAGVLLEIGAAEDRLALVSRDQARETVEREGENGVRYEDSPADNRVRLFFTGKPSEEIRADLKRNGFRWTPSLGCWQAYRNFRSLPVAKRVAGIE